MTQRQDNAPLALCPPSRCVHIRGWPDLLPIDRLTEVLTYFGSVQVHVFGMRVNMGIRCSTDMRMDMHIGIRIGVRVDMHSRTPPRCSSCCFSASDSGS